MKSCQWTSIWGANYETNQRHSLRKFGDEMSAIDLSSIKLEVRKCKGCEIEFKVMSNSKQIYHSTYCENLHLGTGGGAKPHRVPSAAEAHFIETGKRHPTETNFSVMKDFEKKNARDGSEKISDTKIDTKMTPSFESARKPDLKNTIKIDTKKIENMNVKEKPNGKEKTSTMYSNTSESTMQNTETESKASSSMPVVGETQQLDLRPFSESLRKEKLTSMNLINDTTKRLSDVMNSIADKHKGNDLRNISIEEVHGITQIANSMTGLLKVKVEMAKVAKELLKLQGEK
jgi:hypothetical protein